MSATSTSERAGFHLSRSNIGTMICRSEGTLAVGWRNGAGLGIVAFRYADTCVQRSPAHRRAEGVNSPRRLCLLMFSSKLSSWWADAAPLAFGEAPRCHQAGIAVIAHLNIVSPNQHSAPPKIWFAARQGHSPSPKTGLRTGHVTHLPRGEAECRSTQAACGDVSINF